MKKLFISQPMNGKTDDEILNERKIAIERAKEILGEDIEVIDTFYTDFTPDAKPLEYLARSIKDLASADIAYFAKGWEEKRGCKIEYECATQYGIKTIISGTNECLWRFYWDCGRQGEVEGIFKATKEEVDAAIGKEVYFGEILGKHSEVYGEIEEGEITLESDDPLTVMNAIESGYNPLNYLRYECPVCEDTYTTEEWDFENNMCCYCAEEKNRSK